MNAAQRLREINGETRGFMWIYKTRLSSGSITSCSVCVTLKLVSNPGAAPIFADSPY
jgi:hypothetical protein